ncbi:unnamed protein product [Boreogadus saida]
MYSTRRQLPCIPLPGREDGCSDSGLTAEPSSDPLHLQDSAPPRRLHLSVEEEMVSSRARTSTTTRDILAPDPNPAMRRSGLVGGVAEGLRWLCVTGDCAAMLMLMVEGASVSGLR